MSFVILARQRRKYSSRIKLVSQGSRMKLRGSRQFNTGNPRNRSLVGSCYVLDLRKWLTFIPAIRSAWRQTFGLSAFYFTTYVSFNFPSILNSPFKLVKWPFPMVHDFQLKFIKLFNYVYKWVSSQLPFLTQFRQIRKTGPIFGSWQTAYLTWWRNLIPWKM